MALLAVIVLWLLVVVRLPVDYLLLMLNSFVRFGAELGNYLLLSISDAKDMSLFET